MQRVWMALLLVVTIAVLGGVGYVIIHQEPVPRAGQTPGYTAPSTADEPPVGSQSADSPGTDAAVRTVFIGDDYTIDTGASDTAETWTARVSASLNLTAKVIGQNGIGYAKASPKGATYASLVAKAVASKPDLIVVSGGRNDVVDDGGTLLDDTKAFFAELHAKRPDATLVAIAPFWGDSAHPAELTMVDQAVRSGVRNAKGTYLDIADPLSGHPDWMADDAHPNDRGYRAIASAVTAALKAHVPSG